jgi:hypothetical protein
MSRLSNVMSDDRGGVFATTLTKEHLRLRIAEPDVVFLDFDGSKIETAKQFLIALGEQLRVPDLAEDEDWDYLDECLVDLDDFPSAESFVIFFDQFQHLAMAESDKWETILRVFAHAVEEGETHGKPLFIFLHGEPPQKGLQLIDQA